MASMGGFIPALLSVAPESAGASVLIRKSTSSCLMQSDTGVTFPDGDGMHIYRSVQDLLGLPARAGGDPQPALDCGLGCFALSDRGIPVGSLVGRHGGGHAQVSDLRGGANRRSAAGPG